MGHMMTGAMMGGAQPHAAPVAAAPVAAPAPAAPAPSGDSLAERLKKLKSLHEAGLIDEATFAAKRDAILGEI